MMGTVGRSFDILRAVLPLMVNAMIAFDLEISATCSDERGNGEKEDRGG